MGKSALMFGCFFGMAVAPLSVSLSVCILNTLNYSRITPFWHLIAKKRADTMDILNWRKNYKKIWKNIAKIKIIPY